MRPFAVTLSALIVVVGSAASGCTSEPRRTVSEEDARALIGTWSAEDTTRFVFQEASEALWIFGDGADEDTFRIQYEYAPEMDPAHLDLSGFDSGYLRGRTLFCIVAIDSDSLFRLDCEPGEATESGVRPDTFTHQTTTYLANPAE